MTFNRNWRVLAEAVVLMTLLGAGSFLAWWWRFPELAAVLGASSVVIAVGYIAARAKGHAPDEIIHAVSRAGWGPIAFVAITVVAMIGFDPLNKFWLGVILLALCLASIVHAGVAATKVAPTLRLLAWGVAGFGIGLSLILGFLVFVFTFIGD